MKYKNLAFLIIFIVGCISSIFLYFSSQLKFNYDFESYFPFNDPDLKFYEKYRQRFDADDNFFMIGIERESGIFNRNFLNKVKKLSDSLKQIEEITSVISAIDSKEPLITPMGMVQIPLIHVSQPGKYKNDSIRLQKAKGFNKNLVSDDLTALVLIVNHIRATKKKDQIKILQKVENELKNSGLKSYHISGKIKVQDAFVKRMKEELILFVSCSVLLVIVFLLTAFRSLWGILIPLVIVILAIVWTLGLMGLTGQSLNIMTVLLPSILFVVGMSDVVHIITRFIEEIKSGKNKINSLKASLKEVGVATLLTSVTTAIGFLTLLTASIRPIQNFGLYTSAGVLIAFILACSLLPASIILSPIKSLPLASVERNFWQPYLHNMFKWIIKNKRIISGLFIIIIIISSIGLFKIKINSTILEDLPKSSPVKKDYLYFEEKFEGVRPFEMAVWVKDSSKDIFNYKVIQSLNEIQKYLKKDYNVAGIISPVTFVKQLNKAKKGGVPEAYKIPESQKEYNKLKKYISKLRKSKQFEQIIAEEGKFARISGRMKDLGSAVVADKNKILRKYINSSVDTSKIDYRLTGTALLIDKNNKLLAGDMTKGLAIGFSVIGLLMGLLYRSWRIIIFSVIINVIPLLMIAGVIGWFDIGLKASTSIIFTIAFGIAVDDTIHFLSKFNMEIRKGRSLTIALRRTFLSTGKALIVTSLILVAGFMTLILSNFNGTYVTGLMVSLTLMFALFADLLLLPVLLIWFYKPNYSLRNFGR